MFERGKTIFSGIRRNVYFLLKGVKLSRVYEAGEEITVLLREKRLWRSVLADWTPLRSVLPCGCFTSVELLSAPIEQVEQALKTTRTCQCYCCGAFFSILQTEMMIETLAHRDMGSRLVSFLLILCRDFGVPNADGITIDLKLSHQAIAEAIGSTRVVTRLLGDLRQR